MSKEKKSSYKKSRAYTDNTIKRLFALSGNQCAFNTDEEVCQEHIVQDNSKDLMAQICHIEAAEKGGQRYNPNSNDDYRRSFENLILLCPNHHIKTNNEDIYTVEVLKSMKQRHESKMLQRMSGTGILAKNSSVLNYVINKIGISLFTNSTDSMPVHAPDPETKIKHNNIIRYQPIIEEYKKDYVVKKVKLGKRN